LEGRKSHKLSPDENLEFVNKGTAHCVNKNNGNVEEIQSLMATSSAVYSHTRKVKVNFFKVFADSMAVIHSKYEEIGVSTSRSKKVPDRQSIVNELVEKIITKDYWSGGEELTHPYLGDKLNEELLNIETQGYRHHR
jgi:hypothetical protein